MKRPIDWALLVQKLAERGISDEQITAKTGIKTGTVKQMRLETAEPRKEFDQAMELLDLYLVTTESTPPFIGDWQ